MNYTLKWLAFSLTVKNSPKEVYIVLLLLDLILNWIVNPIILIVVVNTVFLTSIAVTCLNVFYVIVLMSIVQNLISKN